MWFKRLIGHRGPEKPPEENEATGEVRLWDGLVDSGSGNARYVGSARRRRNDRVNVRRDVGKRQNKMAANARWGNAPARSVKRRRWRIRHYPKTDDESVVIRAYQRRIKPNQKPRDE